MSLAALTVSAQDVVVKRNGDELQCKITEVNKTEVKYKRWSNQEGPTFSEKKSEIFMIKYENGEKDMIAHESPVLQTTEVTSNVSTFTPSKMTVADPTPISNVYLEYTTRGKRKSGLIKWGHMQSNEQAQNILTNDWLDYKKTRKEERIGKALAITGGSLFLGGLGWTVAHIVYSKRYRDTQTEYDNMVATSKANYNLKYNAFKQAETEYLNAESEYKKQYDIYISLYRNLYTEYYYDLPADKREELRNEADAAQLNMFNAELKLENTKESYRELENIQYQSYKHWDFGYNDRIEEHLDLYKYEKKISLYPMLGGLTTGSALLIVGIIKAKRGHKNATQIVSKHNEEHEMSSKKTGMSKPEFNFGSNGNNLSFSLTF